MRWIESVLFLFFLSWQKIVGFSLHRGVTKLRSLEHSLNTKLVEGDWSQLSSTVLDETDSEVISSRNRVLEEIYSEEQFIEDLSELDSTEGSRGGYDWSFIDQAYLITCPNADPNSQRLNKAKAILDKVGLLDKVIIKEFDTDDEDRIRGCYTSHISVLQDAMDDIQAMKKRNRGTLGNIGDRDWLTSLFSMFDGDDTNQQQNVQEPQRTEAKNRCVLVLEDNLELSGNLNEVTLGAVADYVQDDGNDADMIHLSYIPYVPNLVVSKTDNANIVKLTTGVGSALGTTAYIISESGIQQLLREDAEKGYYAAIPDIMALKFPESRVSSYPAPFLRASKTKSLVNPQLDDLRSVLFQPWCVSQFQAVLTTTGQSTNTIFFTTIATLLVASGVSLKGVYDAGYQLINYGYYDGNVLFPIINSALAIFCLGILALGSSLAPKPPEDPTEQSTSSAVETVSA